VATATFETQGQMITARTVVQVFERAALEAFLKATWNTMKAALGRGEEQFYGGQWRTFTYYIRFIQDGSGVWSIDSFWCGRWRSLSASRNSSKPLFWRRASFPICRCSSRN